MVQIKLESELEYDPISEFIDRQLRSLWKSPDLYMKATHSLWWKYQHIKSTLSINSDIHEDHLIDAIDKKYNKTSRRRDLVGDFLSSGFTQKDIANLTGYHERTIRRDVKKIKERHRWKLRRLQIG